VKADYGRLYTGFEAPLPAAMGKTCRPAGAGRSILPL
jgi:hypothetical protein